MQVSWWRGLIAGASLVAVVAVALVDWLLPSSSAFWSAHAMLTNLVSSALFAVITVTIIESWLRRQEHRQEDARRRAEEQRLAIVRSAAYNAVARGPIAQRRIMWFLVHGGVLRRVPEFEISPRLVHELRAVLARLGLSETTEQDVMDEVLPRPAFVERFPVLAQDEQWRRVVHDVLLDAVHAFRVLVARWSGLLLTTEVSLGALKELAAQAEEFSSVFIEFDARRPAADFVDDRLFTRQLLWSQAFANAVALEEALIDRGGERGVGPLRFMTPGRELLEPQDRDEILVRDAMMAPPLRLYGGSPLPADHPGG